jgi:hypothetical protein
MQASVTRPPPQVAGHPMVAGPTASKRSTSPSVLCRPQSPGRAMHVVGTRPA